MFEEKTIKMSKKLNNDDKSLSLDESVEEDDNLSNELEQF